MSHLATIDHHPLWRRWLALCVAVWLGQAIAVEAMAQPESPPENVNDLPFVTDLPVPSLADLLTARPYDWIVLKNQRVFVVEPLVLRPNGLAAQAAYAAELTAWVTAGGVPSTLTNGAPGDGELDPEEPRSLAEVRALRVKLEQIQIRLVNDLNDEIYLLPVKDIERVVYFEDLMLQRVDALLKENELRKAFDLLARVDQRARDAFASLSQSRVQAKAIPEDRLWPGYSQRLNDLLLREARQLTTDQNYDLALTRLEAIPPEAFRQLQGVQLTDEVGQILIQQALADGNRPKARYYFRRIEKLAPSLEWLPGLREGWIAEARRAETAARNAARQGKFDVAADATLEAVSLWPPLPGLADLLRVRFRRYPILRITIPRENGELSPLDRYRAELAHMSTYRLFDITAIAGGAPVYRSEFVEDWEPRDLERQLVLRLTDSGPKPARPPLTSLAVANLLLGRLNPAGPQYDERLADFVAGLQVTAVDELAVRFATIPRSSEALLAIPLFTGDATVDSVAVDDLAANKTVARRFERVGQDVVGADRYQRTQGRIDEVGANTVQELRIHFSGGYLDCRNRMLRDEADYLPMVHPTDVDDFARDPRFFVQPYQQTAVHLIQFRPDSPLMKLPELRRALQLALDRQAIFDTIWQGRGPRNYGGLVSGPFPSRSPANNPAVQPADQDLLSTLALVFVARKNTPSLPPLRMAVEADPLMVASAEQMVGMWQRAGLEVELVTDPGQVDSCSLLYRRVMMLDPSLELWPFLTMQPRARMEDLAVFPDWLAEEFLKLERTADWPAAVSQLQQLHRYLEANVLVLPLWEVQEYAAVRKLVRGYPNEPLNAFDGINDWIVDPPLERLTEQ